MAMLHNPISWVDPLGLVNYSQVANDLGYTRINEHSHEQAVFHNRKVPNALKHITPDVDQHNGGYWKAVSGVRNLGSKSTRSGIYDINLNRISRIINALWM